MLNLLPQWLEDDEVLLIHGPRRVGKSTLLLAIVRDLIGEHGVLPSQIYYFDLDTLDCSDVLDSPASLIDFIGMPDKRIFVLIDEVQRLQNPGLFLKGVHDLGVGVKLIVSGSSSLEMRSKVRETLSGRKRRILLPGLSWREYRNACPMKPSWQEFLTFGGFPAVVLASDPVEKRRRLLEYYESYLDRDIDSFLRVDRMDIFRETIRLLAFQTGSLVNLNEFAGTLHVSRDLIRRYLTYLEETFIVRRLMPYATNPRKEVSKMPKVYFADCGWRNLVSTGFGDWESRADKGLLLESAVEHWLRERYPLGEIRFWRSQAKAEVDFVVDDGGRIMVFEVKAKSLTKPSIGRSLRSFLKTYQPESVTIVNLSMSEEIIVEGVPVRFTVFPECME